MCTIQVPGTIETDDGANIRFEARGFAAFLDGTRSFGWRVAGAFRFHTEDPRHLWLTTDLAVWEGEFDMNTLRARYRVCLASE